MFISSMESLIVPIDVRHTPLKSAGLLCSSAIERFGRSQHNVYHFSKTCETDAALLKSIDERSYLIIVSMCIQQSIFVLQSSTSGSNNALRFVGTNCHQPGVLLSTSKLLHESDFPASRYSFDDPFSTLRSKVRGLAAPRAFAFLLLVTFNVQMFADICEF